MTAHGKLDLDGMEGKSVVVFLQAFCSAFRNIAEITFASYFRQSGSSGRTSGYLEMEDKQLLDELSRTASIIGAPLWSIFPYLALKSGKHLNFLFDSALTHIHGEKAKRYTVSAEELITSGINGVIEQLPSAYGLTVCSDVKLTDGARWHLPMMDFSIAPSDANRELAVSALKKVGQERGILVNSGNSYHFYGCTLIAEDDWRKFLGYSLLLSPITDPRYVAHRLIDGYCNLRILDHIGGETPRISITFSTG